MLSSILHAGLCSTNVPSRARVRRFRGAAVALALCAASLSVGAVGTAAAADPAPAAAKAGATPAAAAAHPPSCEVEFFGKITTALPAGQQFWVYIADGDCLAKDATILGTAHANDQGGFSIEVFSKWGAKLSMCAAASAGADKPSTLYGKVARSFPAEKTGEIIYDKVEVKLRKGAPHTFPPANPKAGHPTGG